MTAPTSSNNAPQSTESPMSSEYMEMQGNSSPWTELFQADSAPKSRNAAYAASRQSATTASTAQAQSQPQTRRSERSESDQRATQDALSAVFHQD